MCPAFGLHDLAARQSWCLFADRLAAAGYPTIRFDYAGTGDSAQEIDDISSVDTWVANAHDAADFLKRSTGVETLVLVGFSIGALIAMKLASRRSDISEMVVLAPPISGRAYLREVKLSANVVAGAEPSAASVTPADGSLQLAGFRLPAALADSISTLELARGHRLSCARALLLDPPGGTGRRIESRLREAGCHVDVAEFSDFNAFMTAPTLSRPFLKTMTDAMAWMTRPKAASRPKLVSQEPGVVTGAQWNERVLAMGTDGNAAGILCEPNAPRAGRTCAIILNSGRDAHVGWGRGGVETARFLASNGIASLRADFLQVGDSQPDQSGKACPLYSRSLTLQVEDFMNALEARGYGKFHLIGACSGGYAAFSAALEDPRVESIAARNLQRFLYRVDDRVMIPLNERLATAAKGGPGRLLRFLRGGGYRALDLSLTAMSRLSTAVLFSRVRLLRRVRAFSARGGRMLLVYAARHPALPYLHEMFGSGGRELTRIEDCRIEYIEGADHNFSNPRHRQDWNARLVEHMTRTRSTSAAPR